jgi:hypothetical protein
VGLVDPLEKGAKKSERPGKIILHGTVLPKTDRAPVRAVQCTGGIDAR